MKTSIVRIEKLVPHWFHKLVYCTSSVESLTESIERNGRKPVYPIIVVPIPDDEDRFWIISGVSRVDSMSLLGIEEVEVIIRDDLKEEKDIRRMIVDLNKQRTKSGSEIKMEFRHHLEMTPNQRGVSGTNRYLKIGKEMGLTENSVKDMVILNNFFEGEGDCVLDRVFGGELSINQGMTFKKVVEKFYDKFSSEDTYEKLCDKTFDFSRLDYSLSNLDPNDELEFHLMKKYLTREISLIQFNEYLEKMGKGLKRKENHNKNKVPLPKIDENYRSEHVDLIKGNNRTVEIENRFRKYIQSIIGSPPYGDLRLNGDDPTTETGHGMTGKEYGEYLSETYERYKPCLSTDGSVYVIIDDFRNKQGILSCSIEHFVVQMELKGFYLVGRYVWWKNNPQPRSHESKNMVNGFEMVYRFVLDPKNYYSNPNLFYELEDKLEGFQVGCTNTDNRGNTTRGGIYFQPNLKKPRNTLDEDSSKQLVLNNIDGTEDDLIKNINIIKGNVQHPEDYFREDDEKRHTSTSPQYLTMTLILESTKPGDLVLDIWNGVGGTMESSLVLGRDYIGIELEDNYFNQTQRRLQILENQGKVIRLVDDRPELEMVG